MVVQETWYTAPKTGGKKISGGKIPEKLRNTWRTLADLNMVPGRREDRDNNMEEDMESGLHVSDFATNSLCKTETFCINIFSLVNVDVDIIFVAGYSAE